MLGSGLALAGPVPSAPLAPPHPNLALVPLLDDADGNGIRDSLDQKAAATPGATVYLHLLYDRRPTAADADLLTGTLGATRTYIFSNWDWVKVETVARNVPAMIDSPGVVAIEEFVPPVLQNVAATQTTRVRETAAPTTDGYDHTLAVHEDLGYRGEGMVVAILDTGVDNTHEMLDDLDDDPTTNDPKLVIKVDPVTGAPLIGGADASDGFVVVGCVDPQDDHLHGTHVAGTAVGTRGGLTGLDTRGVAPQARLVDVDIAVPVGPGLLGGLVNPVGSAIGLGEDIAFDWIIDFNQGESCFGDPGEFAIDVASMSFGAGGANPSITQNLGITDVVRAGMTFTLASGNSGPNANTMGGGAEGAIIVAASDDRNTASRSDDFLAGFSSRGPRPGDGDSDSLDELRPDITAPGVGVTSAFHHSVVATVGASGTSMATPVVAGIATLMLQAADGEGVDLRPVDLTGNWRDMGLEGAVPIRDLLQKTAEYREEVQPGFAPIQQTATGKFGLPWNNGWGYGLLDAYGAVQLALESGDGDGTPIVTITSPQDGATLEPGVIAVTGNVNRDAGQGLAADAGGPYSATVDESLAIVGTGTGGSGTYTCSWTSDAGGVFGDVDVCATTITFPSAGTATLGLTVSDGVASAQDSATVTIEDVGGVQALYLTTTQVAQGTATDCGPTPTYAMTPDAPTAATSGKAYLGRALGALTCTTYFQAGLTQPVTLPATVDLRAWFSCDRPAAAPLDPIFDAIVPINIDFVLAINGADVAGSGGSYGGEFLCDGATILPIDLTLATGGGTVPAGGTLGVGASAWWVSPMGANDPVPNIHFLVGSTAHPSGIALAGGAAGASAFASWTSLTPSSEVDDEEGDFAQPFMDIVAVSIENDDEDSFDVVMELADLAALPTNPVMAGFSFGSDFCTNNNLYLAAPVCYRLSASREATGDTFGNAVINKNGSSCGYGNLLLAGQIDQPNDLVRWTVPKTLLDFLVPPDDINDCPAQPAPLQGWTRGGAPVTDGVVVSGIKGNTGTRAGGTVPGVGSASLTLGQAGLLGVAEDDNVFGDTTPPGSDFIVGSSDLPLAVDAAGPYTGAVGAPVAVSGVVSGGDGSADCLWSTLDDGSFADAASCTTTVTFTEAGDKTVTLTATDGTASASDDATVAVTDQPAGERVEILVGDTLRATIPTTTDESSPTADFAADLDLAGLSGPQTITANWFDGDTLLDADSVTVNLAEAAAVTFGTPEEGSTVEPPVLLSGTYRAGGSTSGSEGGSSSSSSEGHQESGLDAATRNAALMQTSWYRALADKLAETPGFVGLAPDAAGAPVLTAHYVGTAPAALPTHLVPAGWALESAGGATFEKALRQVTLMESAEAPRMGPPTPDDSTGIGPGSQLAITIPVEGTVGCTANFVWRDATTGKHYLGAAGHCFLPATATATHGPHADYDASGVRTRVCIQACEFGGVSGIILTDHTVELGPVVFAQQGPGFDLIGFGDDFGIVEIPVEHYDLVRTHLPVWNGPKAGTGTMGNGQLILQYGHAAGFGETFVTQARAGVITLPWDSETGPWYALYPSFQGDSGSAVVMGAPTDPTGTVVEGTGAIGILTHLGIPFGTTAGTFVDHAVVMARQAGLEVSIVLEGQPLALPGLTAQFDARVSGFDVTFTDRSFSPDGIVGWEWDFGDGTTGAQQNSVHTYAAGAYTATLTVTDGASKTATASETFEVTGDLDPTTPNLGNGEPTSVALADGEEKHFKILVPEDATQLTVTMTGPACPSPVDCPLDADLYVRAGQRANDDEYDCRPFLTGNDEECSMPDPTAGLWYVRVHSFSGSGTVELTATHDGSSNTPPVAAFTFTTDGLSVLVDGSGSSDADGDTLAFAWEFGDGSQASGPTVAHTYAAGGTYTVRLTVDDGNGGSGTTTQDVTVTAPPAAWSVWVRLDGPAGEALDWTRVADVDPGTEGSWSYLWDPAERPADGSYLAGVRLMADDETRSSATRSFNVEVANQAPTAHIEAPATSVEGQTVAFSAMGSSDPDGTIATYTWDFGDGTIASGPEVTHAFATRGTYTVTLRVVDDDGTEDTAEHTITVDRAGLNQAPTAHISGPDKARGGTPVTFSGAGSSDPDGTIVAWAWDMGDGTTLGGEVVQHTYTQPGPKTIRLTVTDDEGATGTTTHKHIVQGAG